MTEYIERESALYEAEKYACSKGCVSGRHSGIADIIADNILKIPAADVRPERHGHWSDKMIAVSQKNKGGYHEDDYAFGFQCSECGEVLNKTAYCGNCGAKMDGKDDE